MTALSFRFGTVGSPNSTPKRPGGSVDAIQRIKELGLDALELGWVRAVRILENTCAEIKAAGQEYDVLISVHAPYFINLNADDEEWPKSRKRLMDAAYFGNLAGATDIIFHPGSYFSQPPRDVLEKTIPRLAGCMDELRTADNPVTLRPETMGKPALFGSWEDTLALSKSVPGVQPCIDFAHLHARQGNGSMNTTAEWMHFLEAYSHALGKEALQKIHIHLSGIEYGPKGEKKHLPIQEADLDLNAIFQALKTYNAAGRILCESPILEDDALFMRDAWKAIQS